MKVVIRTEEIKDYKSTYQVVKSAFFREDKPDNFNEWKLIEDVRKSKEFQRELSLVAVFKNEVVGHILFTHLDIIGESDTYKSIVLAPIAVKPEYQNKGIGHQLMEEGIKKVKKLGFGSIIVMGHPSYYTKFGFELSSKWHIGLDDDFESKYLFGLELIEGALTNVNGNIKYIDAFYSEDGELI